MCATSESTTAAPRRRSSVPRWPPARSRGWPRSSSSTRRSIRIASPASRRKKPRARACCARSPPPDPMAATKALMVETGGWGGIAHYTWNLCAALACAGVEVSLLTNREWELARLPSGFAVDRCLSAGAGYLANVKALRDRVASARPDVVHVQSVLSTRLDALLWPLIQRRAPVVMTIHNVRTHERIRWDDWTLWRCFAAADAVVVHTKQAADVARQRLPAARIELIHHGDAGFLNGVGRPDRLVARASLGLPDDAPRA